MLLLLSTICTSHSKIKIDQHVSFLKVVLIAVILLIIRVTKIYLVVEK